jgi:ribosomal protein L16 Arg81 hydroxylase
MLDAGWKRWIAENKLLGTADADIAQIVRAKLGSDAGVQAEIEALIASPAYAAAQQLAGKLKKLESVSRNLHKVQRARRGSKTVPRHHKLSALAFFQEFYHQNRPVIITGLMEHWPALQHWSPAYFKAHLGHMTVEVMDGRAAHADYETASYKYKRSMSFGDFADRVAASGPSNDFYMVANNSFFKQAGSEILHQDFTLPQGFLDPQAGLANVFFWFGPAGTVTPLHHDTSNILFMQVAGRKRVRFISPLQWPDVYNDIGVFSRIDPEAPDLAHYPDFANCDIIEAEVGPGDMLFIPVGWWHHVRALDVSISLSSTNFIAANDYVWHDPVRY